MKNVLNYEDQKVNVLASVQVNPHTVLHLGYIKVNLDATALQEASTEYLPYTVENFTNVEGKVAVFNNNYSDDRYFKSEDECKKFVSNRVKFYLDSDYAFLV